MYHHIHAYLQSIIETQSMVMFCIAQNTPHSLPQLYKELPKSKLDLCMSNHAFLCPQLGPRFQTILTSRLIDYLSFLTCIVSSWVNQPRIYKNGIPSLMKDPLLCSFWDHSLNQFKKSIRWTVGGCRGAGGHYKFRKIMSPHSPVSLKITAYNKSRHTKHT